jgi:hypothetical protein
MLQYHPWVFQQEQSCVNADLSNIHCNSRLLYGQWLHQLNRGRTWYGLHYDWPTGRPSAVPEGFDTYVISWHIENWDNDWLDAFCESHPNQLIVIIGEFNEVPRYPNLKTLVHHCWYLVIPYILQLFDTNYQFKETRKYTLSSLCNKPTQLKTLVSAYLLKNFFQRDDLLLSWNAQRPYRCPSMDHLDVLKSRPILEPLVEYYYSAMINASITLDSFEAVAIEHFNYTHEAFANSLINLTNETHCQSLRHDRLFPGPCVSEKTWKPLFSGTGFVPVGQPNTYRYFENFDFRMDYPWPCDFDSIPGDLTRIESVLNTIDWILGGQVLDYEKDILAINRHNYEHIRSKQFVSTIQEINQQNLELFLKNY